MTPKPTSPPRPDLNVCIVGANILGMTIMRAARVSGISRVAVWERDACAMDLRSLVRVFHRWAVPLYVRSSGHIPKHVHCAKDIHWRGPFTHTIICDGREIEGALTGGTRTDPQWGKVMPPRECSHNLALNTEGRDIVESLLRALYIIKSTPGLPVNDPVVRAALGIEEGFGALAIDDFLNEDRESEVPA